MKSQDGKWEAKRLTKYDIQVSSTKDSTSYMISTGSDGFVNGCPCSYGKRPGTLCPHKKLARELVAAEQAPVVVEVAKKSTLQTWLDAQVEDGVQLFA